MQHHDLKLFTRYFQPVVNGDKRSEVRTNDRQYEVGDIVTLHEGQPGLNGFEYTGRSISARISFVDNFGCKQGYVSLSLSDVGLVFAADYPEFLKEQA